MILDLVRKFQRLVESAFGLSFGAGGSLKNYNCKSSLLKFLMHFVGEKWFLCPEIQIAGIYKAETTEMA